MFCSKCGTEIADGVQFCPNCGNQLNTPVAAGNGTVEKINTWLIPAILATVLCCLPFGIVSIVYAVGANTEISNRNFELAKQKAAKAKTWFWVSFACGFLGSLFYIICAVAGAAAD